jgi:hypothetical protein
MQKLTFQSRGKTRGNQEIQKKKSGNTKKLPEILGNIRKYYEIPENTGQKI